VALGVGGVVATLLMLITRNSVTAVVLGTSVTLAMAGFNIGRRDSQALADFPGPAGKAARRASIGHTGKAAWRGLVMGLGSAAAAALIINLGPRGWLFDWVLPVVPAVICAIARQIGLVWEKLGTSIVRKGPAGQVRQAEPETGWRRGLRVGPSHRGAARSSRPDQDLSPTRQRTGP
jgi:hypothetical protein